MKKLSFFGTLPFGECLALLWQSFRFHRYRLHFAFPIRNSYPTDIPRKVPLNCQGSAYHRAKTVWSAAGSLNIHLLPLPSYSPDLMAVEPLWRWLREDVTYHHCHPTAEDLIRRVAAFEADVNADPYAVADRLWVKDHLNPEEEKLRFSK